MSSFLCRLRFIELWRQMVDEVNYNGGYWPEFALQMETKITEVIGNIESYFQSTRDTRKQPHRTSDTMVMEKNLCQVMGQALLLQLHRPFLLKGYSDALYVSVLRDQGGFKFKHLPLGTLPRSVHSGCSAYPPISLHRLSSQGITSLAYWGVVWPLRRKFPTGYTTIRWCNKLPVQAVVLFIDLCHLRQTGIDTEIEARRKEIQSLLHLFR